MREKTENKTRELVFFCKCNTNCNVADDNELEWNEIEMCIMQYTM